MKGATMRRVVICFLSLMILSSCNNKANDEISNFDGFNELKENYLILEEEFEKLEDEKVSIENAYKDLVDERDDLVVEINRLNETVEMMNADIQEKGSEISNGFIVSNDSNIIATVVNGWNDDEGYHIIVCDISQNKCNVYDASIVLPFDREFNKDEQIRLTNISEDKEYIFGVIGEGGAITAPFSIDIINNVAKGYLDVEEITKLYKEHP